MRKYFMMIAALAFMAGSVSGQIISFGLGDPGLELSLNDIGASAKADLGAFSVEISLQWGIPAAHVQATISQGLQPAETYLAAALANLSGKPIATIVTLYKANKTAGWGALAKQLGIKPGSKEFKALNDKSSTSAGKLKKPKK